MVVSEVTDHTCARPALCLAYTDLVRRVVPVSVVIRFVILSSERVAAGCRGGCRSIIVFLVELPAVHRSAVVPHGDPAHATPFKPTSRWQARSVHPPPLPRAVAATRAQLWAQFSVRGCFQFFARGRPRACRIASCDLNWLAP
eukprot:COSAG06_NODE_2192_length_7379_cov_804.628159_8_plen_143_part_00